MILFIGISLLHICPFPAHVSSPGSISDQGVKRIRLRECSCLTVAHTNSKGQAGDSFDNPCPHRHKDVQRAQAKARSDISLMRLSSSWPHMNRMEMKEVIEKIHI
ncbi:hypothetical protein PGT21_009625 [Puccinia graminis f. sp. tritici]|uniref:SWIM-type domain-containing protein n=1 Tax=Puccinia graminis f. sp. tritici TaxID=56615 RepID=A0A5B0LT64_PUCGR|nr:hypothetical protein PGT21_009625 [Puccinia graminis f. sp. tritici]KAA1092190.1 hypothetical protein PGTUg99_018008 [Puccinia graminis f. sp. tritici]